MKEGSSSRLDGRFSFVPSGDKAAEHAFGITRSQALIGGQRRADVRPGGPAGAEAPTNHPWAPGESWDLQRSVYRSGMVRTLIGRNCLTGVSTLNLPKWTGLSFSQTRQVRSAVTPLRADRRHAVIRAKSLTQHVKRLKSGFFVRQGRLVWTS